MIKEELKFAASPVFEGMTSIRSILQAIDFGINDRRIVRILYDKERYSKIKKQIRYLEAVSTKYGFIVEESSSDELEKITLGNSHGGIIAYAEERTIPYLSIDDIKDNGFYAMIEGIEDPYNFGYALRSLYPCGCDAIILQERNWMTAAGVVARSSAGASELFPAFKANFLEAIDMFHAKGYTVVCADERTDLMLGECELKKPILLLVGGEKRGISRAVVDKADVLVKINYSREFNASLSAASATTMFAYEIMRQNSK